VKKIIYDEIMPKAAKAASKRSTDHNAQEIKTHDVHGHDEKVASSPYLSAEPRKEPVITRYTKVVKPHMQIHEMTILMPAILILFVVLGAGGYYGYQYYTSQNVLGEKTTGKSDIERTIAQVSRLITLPEGEKPTVATVSDIGKLKGQAFFTNAQNGDRVLIFTNAKKAILYRPATDKIIEVGPITISDQQESAATPASEPTPTTPVKTLLYNGTNTTGLTRTAEKMLTEKKLAVTVIGRENAAKQDYTKTVVIDLTGKHKATAGQLAKELGGGVGSLPEGEERPTGSEIIVILGSDFAASQ
jgi:hypothetical protein